MAEIVTEEDRVFEMTHEDGSVSKVNGRVITTHHGETDEEGNPKISVHISLDKAQQPWPAAPVEGEE